MVEDLAVKITGIYKTERNKNFTVNKNRTHHALSLRLRSKGTKCSYQNNTVFINKGDILYIPAGLDYAMENTDSEELIVIHFIGYGISGKSLKIFSPSNPHIFFEFFENLYLIWQQKAIGYRLKSAAIFYSILYDIKTQAFDRNANSSVINSIQKVQKHLHDNFTNPNISVKELAEIAGVSETYFRKKFYEIYGCNPLGYIHSLRMEYAAELLQSRIYTVSEVSEKSGFNNPKHFSTLFKKLKGVSPLTFSKL